MSPGELFKQKYYKQFDRLFNQEKATGFIGYAYMYFYEALTLIALGRFEEAEEMCNELLEINYYSMIDSKYNNSTYYALAMAQFYQKKYFSLFTDTLPKLEFNRSIQNGLTFNIIPNILSDLEDGRFPISKVFDFELKHRKSAEHAHFKHGDEFVCDREVLLKTVKEHFNEARVYYGDFGQFRYFKCAKLGYGEKNHKFYTDYLSVYSYNNDPGTITSYYPVSNVGDCDTFDVTMYYNNNLISQARIRSKENQENK